MSKIYVCSRIPAVTGWNPTSWTPATQQAFESALESADSVISFWGDPEAHKTFQPCGLESPARLADLLADGEQVWLVSECPGNRRRYFKASLRPLAAEEAALAKAA